MADVKYDKINLLGLHEPDSTMEPDGDGNKRRNALPGLYSVGFEVNGRFVKIATVKAGDLVDENNKVQFGSGTLAAARLLDDDSDD
jgi:hypothetical protein